MKPLSWNQLALSLVCGGAVGFMLNSILLGTGSFPIILTPFLGVLSLVVAAVLLALGRRVRALRNGDRSAIDVMTALRVVLFARASAIVCAALVGLCIGIILSGLTRLEASAVFDSVLWAGVAGIGLLVWMTVGIIVEKWGQLPEDDEPHSAWTHGASA